MPILLETLRRDEARLGIISNTGGGGAAVIDAVLDDAGILVFFDGKLRLYSRTKSA